MLVIGKRDRESIRERDKQSPRFDHAGKHENPEMIGPSPKVFISPTDH
jgi:hypothetical protein